MVDVREVSSSHDGKPIHWRLLTTHVVKSPKQARRIVDLYRKRWTIEEFFRTLKSAGFDIEEADIGDPKVMIKFVAAAAVATVTIMQLVRARDGTTNEQLAEAFEVDDKPVLEANCPSNSRGPPRGKKIPIPKIRSPSPPGLLPGLEDGPPITESLAQRSCVSASKTSAASNTAL